jgi:hypothetical protein
MQLAVDAAREAIQAGIARRRQAWQPDGDDRPAARWLRERNWEEAALDELVDSLSDEYGAEATLTYVTSEGWTSGLGRGGWASAALFQHEVGTNDPPGGTRTGAW